MASLTNNKIKETYQSLVKFNDNGNITTSAKRLTDGFGNNSPFFVSTTQIGIGVTPTLGFDLHVNQNAKIGGNLNVGGNLTVSGTLTYLDVEDLATEDPLIKLARNNTGNTLDIGFFGKYVESSVTKYKGIFNDADDDKWKFFTGTSTEPTTVVDTAGTGYTKANVVVGDLEAETLTLTSGNDDLTITQTSDDWTINNAQQNNGITIYDGTGGIDIKYNGTAQFAVNSNDVQVYNGYNFSVDTDTLYVDSTNEIVGINSTGNTNYKLYVNGKIASNNYIIASLGNAGVALTHNDGYGNANVTFNHVSGTPEQDGNSFRIECNTDSIGNPAMIFELAANVTSGVAVSTAEKMRLDETGVKVRNSSGGIIHLERDDTSIVDGNPLGRLRFTGDDPVNGTFNFGAEIRGVAAGTWSTDNYPSELQFYTATTDTLNLALTLDESQNATFANNVDVDGNLQVDGTIKDSDGDAGTSGQVLSSTGTGTDWIDFEADTAKALEIDVKNVFGATMTKGTVVHAEPTGLLSGNVIEVVKADNNNSANMPAIGVLNEDLADDAEGKAVMFGTVQGIDTSSFSVGDELYVSATAGEFMNTKPTATTSEVQKVAIVVKSHATNGLIKVFGAGRANDVPNLLTRDITIDNADFYFGNSDQIKMGDSIGLRLQHTGNHTYMDGEIGNMYFRAEANDSEMHFQADDGAGGNITYFRLDGGLATHDGTNTTEVVTVFPDNSKIQLGNGTSGDLRLFHNGTNSYIANNTGNIEIINYSDDKDIIFKSDNGSGDVIEYFRIDGSTNTIPFGRSPHITDNVKLYFGNDTVNDASIKWDSTASQLFIDGVSKFLSDVYFTSNAYFGDNDKLYFGDLTTPDLEIYHDGTHSYINDAGTGQLRIIAENEVRFYNSAEDEIYAKFIKDGAVELYHDGSKKLETTANGATIISPNNLVSQSTVLRIENNSDVGSSEDILLTNPFDRDVGIKLQTLGGYHHIWQDSNGDDSLIISAAGIADGDITIEFYQNHDVEIPNGNLTISGGNLILDDGSGGSPDIVLKDDDDVEFRISNEDNNVFQITRIGNNGADFKITANATDYTQSTFSFAGATLSAATIGNWNTAYNDHIAGISFNTSDGTLTLTQKDGGTLEQDLDGRYAVFRGDVLTLSNGEITDLTAAYQMTIDANDVDSDITTLGDFTGTGPFGIYFLGDNGSTGTTLGTGLVKVWNTGHFAKQNILDWETAYDDKINSASFNTSDGVLTLTRQDAGTVEVDLDGRYLELTGGTMTGDISIGNNQLKQDANSYLTFDDDTTTYNPDTNVATLASVSGIALATNTNDGGGGNFTVATGSTGTELLRITTAGNATFAGNGTFTGYGLFQGSTGNAPTGSGTFVGLTNDYANLQLNGTNGGHIDFSTSGTDYKGRIIYFNSSNSLIFYTNATSALTLDSSQNATFSGDITIGGKTYPKLYLNDNQGVARSYSVGTNNETFTVRNETASSDALTISNANNINFTGKVGVNSTAFSRNLTIGSGAGNEVLVLVASTTGLAQIGLGDTDDDNYSQILLDNSTGKLQIQNGGGGGMRDSALTIDNTENLGIGTQTPTARLDIRTNSATGDNSIDRHVRFKADNGEERFNFFVGRSGNSAYLDIHDSTATLKTKIHSTGDSYFNGGSLGIGTDVPDYKLHIERTGDVMMQLKATDSNQAYMKFVNSTTGDGKFTDGLLFGLDNDESCVFWNYEATSLRFATSGTERMKIDNGGQAIFYGDVTLDSDSTKLKIGDSQDLQLYHDGSNSHISNNTGVLYIDQNQNDGNLILRSDNGSGGLAEYIVCDGGGGGVKIKHYGTTKFETTDTGFEFYGNIDYTNSNFENTIVGGSEAPYVYQDMREYMQEKGHYADSAWIIKPNQDTANHEVVAYQNNTNVFVDDAWIATIDRMERYQISASLLSDFSKVTADKPIVCHKVDPDTVSMNTAFSGTILGGHATRYYPISFAIYSPFGKTDIAIYRSNTTTVDISGTPILTATLGAEQGTTLTESPTPTTDDYFYVLVSDLPVTAAFTPSGGDNTLMSPIGMEVLGNDECSYSFGINDGSVTSAIVTKTNSEARLARDTTGKLGCFMAGTADGAGGDAEFGVPIERLSDNYIYGHEDISNFRLVSYKANKIQVLDKDDNVLYSIDHSAATKNVPLSHQEGTSSGAGTALSTNGPFNFVGSAPFHLVCQSNGPDDECVMLGAMNNKITDTKSFNGGQITNGLHLLPFAGNQLTELTLQGSSNQIEFVDNDVSSHRAKISSELGNLLFEADLQQASASTAIEFKMDGGTALSFDANKDATFEGDVTFNGNVSYTSIGTTAGYTVSNTSLDASNNPEGSGAEAIRLEHPNYTSGTYVHEFAKIQRVSGVPLYLRQTYGSTTFSNIMRFGSHSLSAYEFEVFGEGKMNRLALGSDDTALNASGVPDYPLYIVENTAGAAWIAEQDSATSPTTNATTLTLQNIDNTTNNYVGIGFVDAGGQIAVGTYTKITDQTNAYGSYHIYTRSSAGYSEKITLSSSGNLGVGDPSPSHKLEVYSSGGSIYAGSFDYAGTTGTVGTMKFRLSGGSTSPSFVDFIYGTSQVGAIVTTGSSTQYLTSSDYRLKENVIELTGALDRLDNLQPKRFNFISDSDITVDGFIAHEVSDVVPEAVRGTKDAVDEDGNIIAQGIDQSKLVPLLVAAVQELRAEVELLKSQINS